MRVLQVTGLGLLSLLIERCIDSSEMTQEGSKSEATEHLGDSCLQHVVIFVFAPVSGCKSLSQAPSDSLGLEV